MPQTLDVEYFQQRLAEFAREREWDQYHHPKNLAMALTAEAGELLEIFQWMEEEASWKAHEDSAVMDKTREELADILLYLLRLADKMHIDLTSALEQKLKINAEKYPAHLVKGSALKYHEYKINK